MSKEADFCTAVNLASARLGAEVIYATDDFFADKSRLIKDEPAEWQEDVYDDNGKWMDGWESRRKRGEGYDYCVIRLGLRGYVHGVDIDTTHFTGNFPPSASIDGCYCPDGDPDESSEWKTILHSVTLEGNSHHFHAIDCKEHDFTHIRFNIYPDGGVARLRVYGQPHIDWSTVPTEQELDLLAVENGGKAVLCNDQHFGHMYNLNMPGRGVNMGDGWETARRREPGNDWVVMQLGHVGYVNRIVIDTAHFKGNFPDKCSIQGAFVKGGTTEQMATQSLYWQELLPPQKMSADAIHEFTNEVANLGPINTVRVNIFPDGGLSRVRLFGNRK